VDVDFEVEAALAFHDDDAKATLRHCSVTSSTFACNWHLRRRRWVTG